MHTPSPWTYSNGHIYGPDKHSILCVSCHECGVIDDDTARLIAASPNGLKAAKAMVAAWDEPTSESVRMRAEAIEALRAYIAAAEAD